MLSRRNFLQLGVALPLLKGCYNFSVYEPELIRGDVVHIYTDTVLDRDYTGTQFVIHEGATLDLGGHSLNGRVGEKYLTRAFTFAGSNSGVKNGSVSSFYCVGAPRNGLDAGYLDRLIGVDKGTARQIGDEYRAMANSNFTADGLVIRGMVTAGFYISAFCVGFKVVNCSMVDTGTMHIYCDHGSAGHLFENNYFGPAGDNHITGREGIALDGCSEVIVRSNTFNGRMNMGCINAYTNWGENGITREITRGHSIHDNTFKNNWRGVSLASRHYRRFAGATAPDYAENISVFNNEFHDVGLHVEDLGNNNTVS